MGDYTRAKSGQVASITIKTNDIQDTMQKLNTG